jgi:predicted membrane chloride channel (bestrophin family)
VRRSLLDSALRTAIAVVVIVVLLRWAWAMLHPLLPIIGIAVGIFLVVRAIVAYRRHW